MLSFPVKLLRTAIAPWTWRPNERSGSLRVEARSWLVKSTSFESFESKGDSVACW